MIEHSPNTRYKVVCLKDHPKGYKAGVIYDAKVLEPVYEDSTYIFKGGSCIVGFPITPFKPAEVFYDSTIYSNKLYDSFFECLHTCRKRKIDIILSGSEGSSIK